VAKIISRRRNSSFWAQAAQQHIVLNDLQLVRLQQLRRSFILPLRPASPWLVARWSCYLANGIASAEHIYTLCVAICGPD